HRYRELPSRVQSHSHDARKRCGRCLVAPATPMMLHSVLRKCSPRLFLALAGRFLRAATVVLIGVAVVLLIALRSAKATAAETLLGFGNELMRWPQMHPHSGPRTLSVNGIEFHLVTISTPLSVNGATEQFHA